MNAPLKRNRTQRRAEDAEFRRKRKWLSRNGLAFCCLTGRLDTDLAHLRFFTGASIKPLPRETLPLARAIHEVQETGGLKFWRLAGVPDPLVWAERLHDCFTANDPQSAETLLLDMQDRADRAYLGRFL